MEKHEEQQSLLELHPDLYCLTFLKLYKNENPVENNELVLKSCLTFVI